MEMRIIPGAIVSTDGGFRALVKQALQTSPSGVLVGPEITVPFREIDAEQLRVFRDANPVLVFLDLGDDPATGIRFAQFLVESEPSRKVVAVGPSLSPDMLMEAMRAGIVEYLPRPLNPEALQAAIERVQKKLGISANGDGAPAHAGEILSVFGAKGGAGATTVATNLALQLHRLTGKRTLLIDLDLELGEIAAFLGVQPRFHLVDLVRNFHRMDAELLASYIERHESGVHLLSAPFHPEQPEAAPAEVIRRILRFLKQQYDYVVVDTSKSFSPNTQAAFEESGRILLVAAVDLPSLRNIKRCMPFLDRITGKAADRVQLVVNRFHPDNPITLEEVKRTVGLEVFWTLGNDYESVMRSINTGKPVVTDGKSRFAADLRGLASEVAGIGVRQNGKAARLGPLKRLFGRKEGAAHE